MECWAANKEAMASHGLFAALPCVDKRLCR